MGCLPEAWRSDRNSPGRYGQSPHSCSPPDQEADPGSYRKFRGQRPGHPESSRHIPHIPPVPSAPHPARSDNCPAAEAVHWRDLTAPPPQRKTVVLHSAEAPHPVHSADSPRRQQSPQRRPPPPPTLPTAGAASTAARSPPGLGCPPRRRPTALRL